MLDSLKEIERRWIEWQERLCRYQAATISEGPDDDDEEDEEGPAIPDRLILRSRPIKVLPSKAADAFHLDKLRRPEHFVNGDISTEASPRGTVLNKTTGLIWRHFDSEYPMEWREAWQYIRRLNEERFASRSNWRLPTVEELASLMSGFGFPWGVCVDALFSRLHTRLWTADRCSYCSAWYADMHNECFDPQDFSCQFLVRAVATATPD